MAFKPSITFDIRGSATASEVVDNFCRACGLIADTISAPAQLAINTNLHSDGLQLVKLDPAKELPEALRNIVTRLTKDKFERIDTLSVEWAMFNGVRQCRIELKPKQGFLAYEITISRQQSSDEQLRAIVDSFRNRFEAIDYTNERFQALPEELAAFHRQQARVFAEQQAELLRGHEQLRTAIVEAERRAQARIAEVQQSYSDKESALDVAQQKRSAAVEEYAQTLQEEKRKLDDRGRMHVRREHQRSLATILEKNRVFTHSRRTNSKRWAIHIASLAALAVAVALYAHALGLLAGDPSGAAAVDQRDVAMLLTAALLFGSTLVFYLRWLNDWFRSHAQAEVAVRALDEDFTRAAWLVELLFEWSKDNQGQPFPPELLSSLSRGLFAVSREPSTRPDHPLAEIVSRLPHVREFAQDKKGFRVALGGPTASDSSPRPTGQ